MMSAIAGASSGSAARMVASSLASVIFAAHNGLRAKLIKGVTEDQRLLGRVEPSILYENPGESSRLISSRIARQLC